MSDLYTDSYPFAQTHVVSALRHFLGSEFRPGISAQCAEFVRHVFEVARVPVGVAKTPDDAYLIKNGPFSPSFADSFAGYEVGEKVAKKDDLRRGDIVMFSDTYGSYPKGTITHVGIMDSENSFIHRPTAARPVERAYLTADFWGSHFAQGRRPWAYMEKSLKYFYHDEKASSPDFLRIKYFHHDSKTEILINAAGKGLQVRQIDAHLVVSMPDGQQQKVTLNAERLPAGFKSRFYETGGAATCYELDLRTAGGQQPLLSFQSRLGEQQTRYTDLRVLSAEVAATATC